MKFLPRLRFCSLLLFVALATLASAQPDNPRPRAGRESGFGPWLEPNRDAPAGSHYQTFTSRLAGTEVSYLIYLPPGYDTDSARRYPVIYWLHGRGGNQGGGGNFATRLDAAIKAGKAPAAIVVGLNGRKTSSWVDSFDGKSPVQSVIIQELIPHIDATYRTVATREGRAIEGFSMGGAGAPKIGFKHPELFGTVGVIGGALHDLESYMTRGSAFQDIYGGDKAYYEANDPWSLLRKNADAIRGRTFVRVAVGAKDNLLEKNTAYHDLLTSLGIEHSFDVIPDAAHNPGQVYDGLGDKTWEFYRRAFARISPEAPAAAGPSATSSTSSPSPATTTAPAPNPAESPAQARGPRPGGRPRPTWPQLIERHDANRDGQIARDEFKGPAPLFARLDRNGDGFISQEEHASAGPR